MKYVNVLYKQGEEPGPITQRDKIAEACYKESDGYDVKISESLSIHPLPSLRLSFVLTIQAPRHISRCTEASNCNSIIIEHSNTTGIITITIYSACRTSTWLKKIVLTMPNKREYI